MSHSNPTTELISVVSPLGFGLQARFIWDRDRYRHQIEVVSPGVVRPLLQSIEGRDQEDWPASPPIQHVNLCTIQSDSQHGRVAMLSGAAGDSHWSICVTIRDPYDTSVDFPDVDWGLVFDVACRVNRPPKRACSSYQALSAPVAISEKYNRAHIPADSVGCSILPHNARLEMNVSGTVCPTLQCIAEQLPVTFPATIRWHYGLRYRRN